MGGIMVLYILAFTLLNVPEAAPELMAPHKSRESCMVAAAKLNNTDESLRSKGAREVGAEYVCLKIERTTI